MRVPRMLEGEYSQKLEGLYSKLEGATFRIPNTLFPDETSGSQGRFRSYCGLRCQVIDQVCKLQKCVCYEILVS